MSEYKIHYSTDGDRDDELIIGISALNEENTILNVINTVQEGLLRYFPQYDSTIVIAVGDPDDSTVEVASSMKLPENIEMKIIDENGEGKGDAIRALMEITDELDGDILTLLDGDLISIKPSWLSHLMEPIRYGIADFVSPRYLRGKHDGGITKMFSYPLISTLFGEEIRQPIGGEMAMDSEFVKKCLEKDYFPSKFGIDTFLTFTALNEGFRISQAPLGARFHASTGEYEDPLALLGPMFSQVSKTTFDLIELNREDVKMDCDRDIFRRKYRNFDNYKGIKPTTPTVDTDMFWDEGLSILKENESYLNECFERENWIKKFEKKETLTPGRWSDVVFNLLDEYIQGKDRSLQVLQAFWYARYASFIEETKDLTLEETEEKVYENFEHFWNSRDKLLKAIE